MDRLRDASIASAIYYPIPLHKQKAFIDTYRAMDLATTEQVAQQCLSLPMYPELNDEAIEEIVAVIKEAVNN
jgi:dTDP-4-amino-4,6-dideoxygalactose transaminase